MLMMIKSDNLNNFIGVEAQNILFKSHVSSFTFEHIFTSCKHDWFDLVIAASNLVEWIARKLPVIAFISWQVLHLYYISWSRVLEKQNAKDRGT